MTDQRKYGSKLSGKHVLIIGGSSGIGFAVAEGTLEGGAAVTISSSSQARVDQAVERLSSLYPSMKGKITGHACDLGTEDTLEANVEALFEKVGKVDHIIFTAGDRLATMPLQEASLAKIRQAGMVRYFAPLIVAKVGSRYIGKGPESSITFTTGSISQKPMQDWSVVAGYASGLHAMTRNLALDLKPVRVNLISPGAVDTELWDHMPQNKRQAMLQHLGSALPTGGVGQAEDVAEAYFYVMKDRNITGTVISTNGGALLA